MKIITTEKLAFSYGKKRLLKNINLNIEEGSFVSILGKNGSGKTTLIKILMKLLKSKANIKIEGQDYAKITRKALALKVAYVPQILERLENVTVFDYVGFARFPYNKTPFLTKKDKKIVEDTLKKMNIYNLKNEFVSNLSGGQKQKVAIANAIAQQTKIIILDEPNTYLDIYNHYEVMEILRRLNKSGKTIITVLHDINLAARYSSQIILLKDGELVVNKDPGKAITAKNIKDTFNVDVILDKQHQYTYVHDVDTTEIRKKVENEI